MPCFAVAARGGEQNGLIIPWKEGNRHMSTFYETQLRVDSRDVDLFNHCRPSALLGIVQEAHPRRGVSRAS